MNRLYFSPRRLALVCAAAIGIGASGALHAGSALEQFDYTGFPPSPIAGQFVGTSTPVFIDERCMPLQMRMNTSRDPVAAGADGVPTTLAVARAAVQTAMQSWNEIPTSYVELKFVGTTPNPGLWAFDFVNEASFNWPATLQAAGQARWISLAVDVQLEHGDDIDGDGDADVSSAILTCADADGDGDIEFPAGFYRAGSILDADIRFNPALPWHLDARPPGFASFDLVYVAAHELGHAFGLGHSSINQTSPSDGKSSVMHCCSIGVQGLHVDDIAWASWRYPEGSLPQGPGALQSGDIAFEQRYAVIRGEVRNAAGQPIAGAVIAAEDLHGRVVSSTVGGRVQVSVGGGLPFQFLAPSHGGLADGAYALPVPKGIYRVAVEPNDGVPDPSFGSGWAGEVGFLFGNQTYVKEYHNGALEGLAEHDLGQAMPVAALADRDGIHFRLDANRQLNIDNSDDTFIDVPVGTQDTLIAVRVPRADILALDQGRGVLVQAALFGTLPFYQWQVARFDAALVTTGRIDGAGRPTIDLAQPLVRRAPFIGADNDLTPLYLPQSLALGQRVQQQLAPDQDLFVVLVFAARDFDPDFPQFSLYGVMGDIASAAKPVSGNTYASFDGGRTWFRQRTVDASFGLVVAPR